MKIKAIAISLVLAICLTGCSWNKPKVCDGTVEKKVGMYIKPVFYWYLYIRHDDKVTKVRVGFKEYRAYKVGNQWHNKKCDQKGR